MRNTDFFDMISELCSIYIEMDSDIDESISEAYQHKLSEQARVLLFDDDNKQGYSFDTFCKNSQKKSAIINACRDAEHAFFVLSVLTKLDSIIIPKILAHDYSYKSIDEEPLFTALNNNFEETNIYILPKLPNVGTVRYSYDEKGERTEILGEKFELFDKLNSKFRFIRCVFIDKQISLYSIKNIIIDEPKKRNDNMFRVAFSPVCNSEVNDVFSVKYIPDPTAKDYDERYITESLYYTDINIKNKEKTEKICENVLKKSCSADVDMLVFPEMFGTEKLSEKNHFGLNSLYYQNYKKELDKMPEIIVAPSYWKDNTNSVSIFAKTGEFLGSQYKQFPYKLSGPKGEYTEKLLSKKEITIVHIYGIGSFAFPICVDFLHDDYIRMLITKLKVNWIICPAFSDGTRQFEQKIKMYQGLGARCLWFNSCSAISGLPEPPNYIGLVASPIISSESTVLRIEKKCGNNCMEDCMFVISIPHNSAGSSLHEDELPKIEYFKN